MHRFYYDETQHSRKITLNTITSEEFYDGFVVAVVGWDEKDEEAIARRYEDFERRHRNRASKGEIKSATIKPKQLEHGFASLSRANRSLVNDFLSLFDDKVYVYLCYASKTEYMVDQLFGGYGNSRSIVADLMRYSIVKTIVQYRPNEIIEAMYGDPSSIVPKLRKFFYERLKSDMSNIPLKRREIDQYGQILMLLDSARQIKTLEWDYSMPFVGLSKYLDEMDIVDCELVIDKESNTEQAARDLEFRSVLGMDSRDSFGLRMADMLVGLTAKLMRALHEEVTYHGEQEHLKKRLVAEQWFSRLGNEGLASYKKLANVVLKTNNAWHKVFAGVYSDDLVLLIALLALMNGIDSSEELSRTASECPERLNTIACERLEEHYGRIEAKPTGSHSAFGYPIISNAPALPLRKGTVRHDVISVGLDGVGAPLILIDGGRRAICFRLPDDLRDWACNLASLAGTDLNVLPSNVMFTTANGRHYADIL